MATPTKAPAKAPAKSTAPPSTDAPKTRKPRAAKDPAAPAMALVKRAEADLARAKQRQDKALAATEKVRQSLETAEAAQKQVDAEVDAAVKVLDHARSHPLLAGPTLDEAAAEDEGGSDDADVVHPGPIVE